MNFLLNKSIKFFLENRFIAIMMMAAIIIWGISVSPFNWNLNFLPSDPVPVDAIPDIGDNQQIIATDWMGRSPKDVQEQITYPLTTVLLGIPGVRTIRSSSMFGMSFIYVIFDDDIEFYWSRSRILERLNSMPQNFLPEGVQPTLGPDATALGQVFWYTLEARNPETGRPTGGWDPDELRTIQDFHVKYSLLAATGVSEIASIGGFVMEYQVELNPDAMRAYGVSVMDIMYAIEHSNLDVGAETIEINLVEYIVRGLGYIRNKNDLEETVVTVRNNIPIKISDVANVNFGPATRRGGLDKEGVEAVGGVVVARYGSNPMLVINNIKTKIDEISAGLPQKILEDGTISKVTIVPFYDRSGLIRETIGTLETAITHQILICIIVVIILMLNLRASFIISTLLPITVLLTFIIMRYANIHANIVSLSGIAIAIGVVIDVGVVIIENVLSTLNIEGENIARRGKEFTDLIYRSISSISGALATAMMTTVISLTPIFLMQAQEGKLFQPLAFTKMFAIFSSFVIGFTLLPTIAYYVLSWNITLSSIRKLANWLLIIAGIVLLFVTGIIPALALSLFGINNLTAHLWKRDKTAMFINIGIAILAAIWHLAFDWLPMGTEAWFPLNLAFVIFAIGIIMLILWMMVVFYEKIIRWCLKHKLLFLMIPLITVFFGVWIFKNMGNEFMPSLDEGSFLLMPTTMPHTGIEQNIRLMQILNRRTMAIPEIDTSVGKWGRVESALDPAPAQMFENTINYLPEYILDENGRRMRFKTINGAFVLKDGSTHNPKTNGFRLIPVDSLIVDKHRGSFFRQWRPQIKNPDDIWKEIVDVTHLPGLTSAPKLQPIEARLVMLATGLRAPMGLKVSGPNLESIEQAGMALETALKDVPSVSPATVFYDRAVGAPYIEIYLNRRNMARHGVTVADLQEIIAAAVGGMTLTTTVEGRERFGVRLRYPRELRDNPETLARILIPTASGAQVPLGDLVDIEYAQGAQMIQSENTFLIGYVIFDKQPGIAEITVVQEANRFLRTKLESGELILPDGVSYVFAGNFENQQRATRRLTVIIPICLFAIFMLLYLHNRNISSSLIHFSGVFVAFSGGFILLWLYGQPWFLNINIGGENLRDIFQMHPINLSIAVWVGFISLFGIATDDGVLIGTYIRGVYKEKNPRTIDEIRDSVVMAGLRRVRPAVATTATTLIALLPVLTSTGRGADIMVPMAIPTFGGMLIQSMTMFIVPVLQCWVYEVRRQKI